MPSEKAALSGETCLRSRYKGLGSPLEMSRHDRPPKNCSGWGCSGALVVDRVPACSWVSRNRLERPARLGLAVAAWAIMPGPGRPTLEFRVKSLQAVTTRAWQPPGYGVRAVLFFDTAAQPA